jgi:hypothetical protein
MVDNPPDAGIVFAQQGGRGLNRHLSDQSHDQRLEKQSKSGAGPSPRGLHLFHSVAASLSFHGAKFN